MGSSSRLMGVFIAFVALNKIIFASKFMYVMLAKINIAA